MSTRKRGTAVAADDLAGAPFLDDTERAEFQWLLAREDDPSAPAPSAEIAADYIELEDLLGSLPLGSSDETWQDDVLRAVAASTLPSRPWWRTTMFRWAMRGALATAAAGVVFMLLPQAMRSTSTVPMHSTLDERQPPKLEVAVRHIRATRGALDEAAVGDHLVITARPREVGDLRVYRSEGTLVARCPSGPGCRGGSHGEQTIEIAFDAPGQYHVILVDGLREVLPDGAMDVYVNAPRPPNVHFTYRTIAVY
jgi:hypothetical protein